MLILYLPFLLTLHQEKSFIMMSENELLIQMHEMLTPKTKDTEKDVAWALRVMIKTSDAIPTRQFSQNADNNLFFANKKSSSWCKKITLVHYNVCSKSLHNV